MFTGKADLKSARRTLNLLAQLPQSHPPEALSPACVQLGFGRTRSHADRAPSGEVTLLTTEPGAGGSEAAPGKYVGGPPFVPFADAKVKACPAARETPPQAEKREVPAT